MIGALSRSTGPRVRRRWPSAAFVLGVIATALFLWRVATARTIETLPPAGVPLRVTRVIDGDTLLLEGDFRVRLLGVNTPETNILIVEVTDPTDTPQRVVEELARDGVLCAAWDARRFRMVTHLDVSFEDTEQAAAALVRLRG